MEAEPEVKWFFVFLMVVIASTSLTQIFAPPEQEFETKQKLESRDVHRMKVENNDTTFIYKTK